MQHLTNQGYSWTLIIWTFQLYTFVFLALRVISIKFLFVIWMPCKTEWSLARLPPNGCPVARGAYDLPSGDQNFKQAPKTYDSQANFQWTNNKIPCSFCTFDMTKENIVWSSAIGKNILPLIKGKQTALMSWNSLLWLLLQSSWSFSSENGVKWII